MDKSNWATESFKWGLSFHIFWLKLLGNSVWVWHFVTQALSVFLLVFSLSFFPLYLQPLSPSPYICLFFVITALNVCFLYHLNNFLSINSVISVLLFYYFDFENTFKHCISLIVLHCISNSIELSSFLFGVLLCLRPPASDVLWAGLLVLYFLLWAESASRGDLPRLAALADSGRLYGPVQLREILPGSSVQCQPQRSCGADTQTHW